MTAKAKQNFRFDQEDLLRRGRRLIRESVECGVTSMRAHVEVDIYVGMACLEVALRLKEEFKIACHVQIAGMDSLIYAISAVCVDSATRPVFAQEPLFTSALEVEVGSNYRLLQEAAERPEVEVIGSAPYVEPTISQSKQNIALILELAGRRGVHADFHLDYNLDPTSEPLIYEVVSQANKLRPYWLPVTEAVDDAAIPRKRITIGHATRLQLFTPEQWKDLAYIIGDLPITFVGLPNSDLYMQGRGDMNEPLGAPRGTLRVPYIARNYGFQMAMSVNNIENAFTPQGSVDPLALCTLGAAIFQSATPADIRTLAVPDVYNQRMLHILIPLLLAFRHPDLQACYRRRAPVLAARTVSAEGRPIRFRDCTWKRESGAGRAEPELRPYHDLAGYSRGKEADEEVGSACETACDSAGTSLVSAREVVVHALPTPVHVQAADGPGFPPEFEGPGKARRAEVGGRSHFPVISIRRNKSCIHGLVTNKSEE